MRKSLFVALGVLAGAALAWMGSSFAGDEAAAAIGQPAPGFTLTDQTGNSVSLSDYAGKIVVLEWINPECPFVQRHYKAKTMMGLVEKYKGKDVVWLAVNSTKSADLKFNAGWVSDHGLTYPILDDHEGKVGRLYSAKTTPHMYIIDAGGKLVYRGAIDDDPGGSSDGAKRVNYVEKALDELLSGQPVSTPQTKSYGCSVKYAA
jgi:peroxiredoxin